MMKSKVGTNRITNNTAAMTMLKANYSKTIKIIHNGLKTFFVKQLQFKHFPLSSALKMQLYSKSHIITATNNIKYAIIGDKTMSNIIRKTLQHLFIR